MHDNLVTIAGGIVGTLIGVCKIGLVAPIKVSALSMITVGHSVEVLFYTSTGAVTSYLIKLGLDYLIKGKNPFNKQNPESNNETT